MDGFPESHLLQVSELQRDSPAWLGWFSLRSQPPALDGEMATDSSCLWSHQLVPLCPQEGRFYVSGVGVAGSWECRGGELPAGQSRASIGVKASASLGYVCSQCCLQRQKLLFSLNKSSSSLNSTMVMGVEISEMAERPTEQRPKHI